FRVKALPRGDAALLTEVDATLTQVSDPLFSLAFEKAQLSSNEPAAFVILIENHGTFTIPLAFSASDARDECTYNFAASAVEVGPGESPKIELLVTPKEWPLLNGISYRFKVLARLGKPGNPITPKEYEIEGQFDAQPLQIGLPDATYIPPVDE